MTLQVWASRLARLHQAKRKTAPPLGRGVQSPLRSLPTFLDSEMFQSPTKFACTLFAASALVAGAAHFSVDVNAKNAPLLEENLGMVYGPKNYAEALAAADRDLQLAQARTDNHPKDWLNHQGLAMGHLIKAQLTGSFDNLAASLAAIEKGMGIAPVGTGPVAAASAINLSLHRYPQAEALVGQYDKFSVKLDSAQNAEMIGQRGEIAFYSGDYQTAKAQFETAFSRSPTPNNIFRLANWEKYCGDFDKAIALYAEGARDLRYATPQTLAAYHLQIGALELQRGNWKTAAEYFDQADSLFPGFWLTRAHQAQMLAVDGKLAKARKIYGEIIAETGNPDVMMALADLEEFRGAQNAAKTLRKRAAAIFAERLKVLPESYYDHGLDLALASGDNARALRLARANFNARPYGDAQMALARSLAANGKAKQAKQLLLEVTESGWKSVELNLDLAEAYRLSGDTRGAKKFEKRALELNPKALDPKAGLLAFGSH